MRYVKNNQVLWLNELRSLYPHMSIPEGGDMTAEGWYPLQETPMPSCNVWNVLAEDIPVNNVQTWKQVPMSEQEIEDACIELVQTHMDTEVQGHGYYNMLSACSYAGASNPYQEESVACIGWRGNVWATCYQILSSVRTGNRPVPTPQELIALLPPMVWPVKKII